MGIHNDFLVAKRTNSLISDLGQVLFTKAFSVCAARHTRGVSINTNELGKSMGKSVLSTNH